MSAPNEIRVFISSTFRDLQGEREHLVKRVFPEIRALCRARGVTFTDIDLRWGITEEEALFGRIIRICLEEIDKCRPYFIGIIGSRYGWAPELHEVGMDPELLRKYPFIEELVRTGTSITEMEFIHGVFAAPPADGQYTFFYQRNGDHSNADAPERLELFIQRTRSANHPFREFATIEELGEMVRSDLMAMIERNWPDQKEPTPLELERRAHAAFAASRIRAYIPNPNHLMEFSAWLAEGGHPLVVQGAAGLGKSSLVAWLVEEYRGANPAAFVVTHYVGASQSSGTAGSVMRHLIESIRHRFSIAEATPPTAQELQKSFANWLFRCGHLAMQEGVGVLMVIDAVNQLDDAGRTLSWLPETIPPGVRLMVSATPGDVLQQLANRGWNTLQVGPLMDQQTRRSIVARYLGEFHKGIRPEQLHRIVGDQKGASPLYLRLLSEELRLHGAHETLDEVIGSYTSAPGLPEVFDTVLQRMEQDYGTPVVQELLSLIALSRSGLSEKELLELLRISRLDLSRLLFALEYYLLWHNGLLGFFHGYLRNAVERRYLARPADVEHRREFLAEHFNRTEKTLRSTMELLHALEKLGDRQRLHHALSDLERFPALWRAESHEVLRLWSKQDLAEVIHAYQEGMERWQQHHQPSNKRAAALRALGEFYERVGAWQEGEWITQERIHEARTTGNRQAEGEAMRDLAGIARQLGRMEEALALARQAEEIARQLDDHRNVAFALAHRGIVHYSRGEYDPALECFSEWEEIMRSVGDRRSVANAVGNRGNIHLERGEYALAIACFAEDEAIARQLGDRAGTAFAIGHRGSVHSQRGEYALAIACFAEQEAIARELGDRRSIASAVGNRSVVYLERGQYDLAIPCIAECEAISRQLGDRISIAAAVGNRGIAHSDCGQYSKAIACFVEQEAIARELGDRISIATAIGNRGIVHHRRGEHANALACLSEQEAIARELGDRVGIALSVGEQAAVHAECKEYDQSLASYWLAESEARAIEFRHGLCSILAGTSEALLELAEAAHEMPEYLPQYLANTTAPSLSSHAGWHPLALERARATAQEAIAISKDLAKPDTFFQAQLLLSRITAAEGNPAAATDALAAMLLDETDAEHQAAIHFWLWKLNHNGHHRAEALRLYRSLFQAMPKHDFRTRINELTDTKNPFLPQSDHATD